LSVKSRRLHPTRRSIIAASAGLAAAGFAGNSAPAQAAGSDLPDALDGITKIMPQAAPDMRFTNGQGRHLGLADYAGHALLVNLWATWCGPCVDELPTFATLAPKLRPFGALVLPISIDLTGAAAVRPFFKSQGIASLPILLDPNGDNMQVLDTDGIPVTIVINAAGQMVARLDGAANWDTPGMLDYLQSLGGQPRDSKPVGFIPL